MFAKILTTLLLLAPLASAGGIDAHVDYLEGSGSCDGSSTWSDGGTWWHASEASRCDDRFDYAAAAASAEGQTVEAGAGAREHDASARNETGYGESYSGDGYSYGQGWAVESWKGSSGWSREAWASAGGASFLLTHGCADGAHGNETRSEWWSSSWTNDTSRSYGSWSSSDGETTSSGCGERADAAFGGTSASAGLDNRCTGTTSSSDWGWYRGEYVWSDGGYGSTAAAHQDSDERSVSDCGSRASAEGPVGADAGTEDRCESASWSRESWEWDGNSSWNHTERYRSRECAGGVSANGPDGARVFVGRESWASEYCAGAVDAAECEGYEYDAWYASLDWRHGPLGPYEQRVYLPLP